MKLGLVWRYYCADTDGTNVADVAVYVVSTECIYRWGSLLNVESRRRVRLLFQHRQSMKFVDLMHFLNGRGTNLSCSTRPVI